MLNISKSVSYHGLAESLIIRAEYLIEKVQGKFENLNPQVRMRRGFFNGEGELSKWLFETL